jgi:hypothetical protein
MIKKSKVRVHISLDKDKLEKFKKMARSQDLTLSQLISRKLSDVPDQEEILKMFVESKLKTNK